MSRFELKLHLLFSNGQLEAAITLLSLKEFKPPQESAQPDELETMHLPQSFRLSARKQIS